MFNELIEKEIYENGYTNGYLDAKAEDIVDCIVCSGLDIKMPGIPEIKDVNFNDPATIVFWNDGTKTVVKTQSGEPYDKEKGLAMAIIKKVSDNKGSYYDVFHKWCPEEAKRP